MCGHSIPEIGSGFSGGICFETNCEDECRKNCRTKISKPRTKGKFLNGATPEAAAEIEALEAGIWEHFKPVGALEEILVQKVVVEAARYSRVVGFEQKFEQSSDSPILLVARLEIAVRYTTSTSRALYRAIQELERVQAARKAAEGSDASPVEEPPVPMVREEQPDSGVPDTIPSKSSTPEFSEDPEVLRLLGR